MKLWSGRFEADTDQLADLFNSSLPFDIRLYRQDIEGSIAHCTMLAHCGILTEADRDAIVSGLQAIRRDIEDGKLAPEGEDVHMFVEGELIKRLGDTGKRLHTARSRNDQVATDFRLYIKQSILTVSAALIRLTDVLHKIATEHIETIMPGYTHLQKAQPVTLAHHMSAYCEMFLRDLSRLRDCYTRTDSLPLGSCALAGTTYPIDRRYTADLLGFAEVCGNSMDGVSDRDFALEYLFCCSTVAMHMSRLCEELILWSSDEFRFARISDAYSTGSSIMPQKKNPDMAELIRGKTGRIYGNLMSLLTVMKGIPLAYNKDMQEDKEPVFDSENTILLCLSILAKMLEHTEFNRERMREGALSGFTNATDVADYLVKKGVPFRSAHEITGKTVLYCEKHGIRLEDLPLEKYREFSPVFGEDILEAVDLNTVVGERKCTGGPAKEAVEAELKRIAERLETYSARIAASDRKDR